MPAYQTLDAIREDGLFRMLTGTPYLILGAYGTGKSDVARLIAQDWSTAIGAPVTVIDMRASQFDAVDTRGIPAADLVSKTTVWLTPSLLPQRARDGEHVVILLDELTNAKLDVQAALFQLVLDNALGDWRGWEGIRIIATGNTRSDRGAAQRFALPLADRFAIAYVKPDAKPWRDWARAHAIHPALIDFMAFRPELIHVMPTGDEDMKGSTPRSITRIHKALAFLPAVADTQMRRLVTQDCGEAFATEFMAFLPIWRSMPPLKTILANPDTTPVPSEREASLRYAIASALAGVVDATTFAAGMAYAKRMGAEYRGLMIDDAIARDATLTDCKAYVDYAIAIARVGEAA